MHGRDRKGDRIDQNERLAMHRCRTEDWDPARYARDPILEVRDEGTHRGAYRDLWYPRW